ncbi:HAMP domain-containing histidine kinase [Treponema pectinovorum]|uniref:sensor histidine kinase n=1 Tax=Treponema pectinovorum TaxID=164 RepID=UPI003D8FFDB5
MIKNNSVVFRLSVKFASVLALTVLSIIFIFFLILRFFNRKQELVGFMRNANMIERALVSEDIDFLDRKLSEIPFFISYVIYENSSGFILREKNNRLGILNETGGKPISLIARRQNSSEPLQIIYITKRCILSDGKIFIIQLAQNTNIQAGNRFILNMLSWLAISSIPVLLISFLISIYMTKSTLLPVVKITNAAASISSTNLDKRLPESGKNDELDNLAKTFNTLFSKLKTDFERERSFTSNVSHELKTPLAVILGQANLLRRWGKNDSEQLEKSLGIIIQETNSMQSIIKNLLQLGTLENKKIELNIKAIDINLFFKRLKEEFKSVNPNCVIKFSQDVLRQICTDEELLHQVFVCVISNSIKFVKENPKIHLRCIQDDKKNIFEIDDNGQGFNKEVLPHVFERFYRGDSSHNRAVGGSGLGLSIAQAIVEEALNGKIECGNSANGGALVKITLIQK